MKVFIRHLVVDRIIEGQESDERFIDEYGQLEWTLAAAIVLATSGGNTYVRFYFTKTVVVE